MTSQIQVAKSTVLSATERFLSARVAWHGVTKSARAKFVHELDELRGENFRNWRPERHGYIPVASDFSQESLVVFVQWQELKDALQASSQAKIEYTTTQQSVSTDAKMPQELLKAKFELRKLMEDQSECTKQTLCDVYQLNLAVFNAKAAGVNPRDLSTATTRLEGLLGQSRLRVYVVTLAGRHEFNIALNTQVREFTKMVAEELHWAHENTQLSLSGIVLKDDYKMLYEYQVSPERCEFLAMRWREDRAEDHAVSCVRRVAESTAAMAPCRELVGLPPARPALLPAQVRVLDTWTTKLIEAATCRGFLDISDAASLMFQVENGELTETDTRKKVRAHAIAACPDDAEPLADVDKQFETIMEEYQHQHILTPERQQQMFGYADQKRKQHDYSQETATEMRAWKNDPNAAVQGRGLPTSQEAPRPQDVDVELLEVSEEEAKALATRKAARKAARLAAKEAAAAAT